MGIGPDNHYLQRLPDLGGDWAWLCAHSDALGEGGDAAFQLVLSLVGYALGGPFGGFIGGILGGYIDRRVFGRSSTVDGPRLEDLRQQVSTYGQPIQEIWGSFRVAGNVIWARPLREERVETEEEGVTLVTYIYFATFAVGLCKGPIDRVLRIWAKGELIYDLRSTNLGPVGIPGLNIRIYDGDETQLADPAIEEFEGEGMVPGFRGLAYAVIVDFPLKEYGNRIPDLNFEVMTRAQDVPIYDRIENSLIGSMMVVDPQRPHIMIAVSPGRTWQAIDISTGIVLYQRPLIDIPMVSTLDGIFDIDENGVIYTNKDAPGGAGFFQTLDSRDFDPILTSPLSSFLGPQHFCVIKNPRYPYLYAFEIGETTLYVVNRNTLERDVYNGPPFEIPRPESGIKWRQISADSFHGRAYALICDTDSPPGPNAYIAKLQGEIATFYQITASMNPGGVFTFITYDQDSNQVIVLAENDYSVGGAPARLAFFDAENMLLNAKIAIPEVLGANYDGLYEAFRKGPVNGFLWFHDDFNVYKIDIARHAIERTYPVTFPFEFFGGGFYDPVNHAYIFVDNPANGSARIVRYFLDRGQGLPVKLFEIVKDVCEEVGLDPVNELATSELTDDVTGYIVNERVPGRSAIEPLMDAYFFDGIDSDGLIKFPKRGKPSILTISDDELASHLYGEDRPGELVTARAEELELPVLVEVEYADAVADYQTGHQSERRLISQSDAKALFRLPLVLSADQAKQIAVKHLGIAWAERTTHELELPKAYFDLDAGDTITIVEGGVTHIVRVNSLGYRAGTLELKAVNEDSSAFFSDALGVGFPGAGASLVTFPGQTEYELIDTAMTALEDDRPGLLVGARSSSLAWHGAQLFRCPDGISWEPWNAILTEATMGRAQTALGTPPDPQVWDEGSTVTIRLDEGSLSSATMDQVLGGANLAILGDELIQYRTAAHQADGSWILSGFLRARFGTDWATTHAVGDRFVVIDSGVKLASWPLTDQNVLRHVRADSIGAPIGDGIVQPLTCQFRNLKPLAPEHITGARHSPSTNDLTITWRRRTRIPSEWRDSIDVPLGEASENYSVDIVVGGVVVRTIDVVSESALYRATEQSSDGLTPGNPVTVRVYQVSVSVGRGFPREATI